MALPAGTMAITLEYAKVSRERRKTTRRKAVGGATGHMGEWWWKSAILCVPLVCAGPEEQGGNTC